MRGDQTGCDMLGLPQGKPAAPRRDPHLSGHRAILPESCRKPA
jgi:hypothetical protein